MADTPTFGVCSMRIDTFNGFTVLAGDASPEALDDMARLLGQIE